MPPILLLEQEFAREKLPLVQAFYCGGTDWQIASANWIKTNRAVESIEQFGTEVWLYFEPVTDRLVGYGSLGRTRRRWPSPSNDYLNLSIIPQLAVAEEFWGEPDACQPEERFSSQIMLDLIAKAKEHGTPLLILDVHKDNERAIVFYERFDFQMIGYEKDNHLRMALNLT